MKFLKKKPLVKEFHINEILKKERRKKTDYAHSTCTCNEAADLLANLFFPLFMYNFIKKYFLVIICQNLTKIRLSF